jgi:hypothetical protein
LWSRGVTDEETTGKDTQARTLLGSDQFCGYEFYKDKDCSVKWRKKEQYMHVA